MLGYITWLNAIAGHPDTMTYLWGSPTFGKFGVRLPNGGDGGKPIRTFEFEKIPDTETLTEGSIFFYRPARKEDPDTNNFRLGIRKHKHGMWAFGSHIYPMPEERWRIVKEIN
jgi:hypothetical protein